MVLCKLSRHVKWLIHQDTIFFFHNERVFRFLLAHNMYTNINVNSNCFNQKRCSWVFFIRQRAVLKFLNTIKHQHLNKKTKRIHLESFLCSETFYLKTYRPLPTKKMNDNYVADLVVELKQLIDSSRHQIFSSHTVSNSLKVVKSISESFLNAFFYSIVTDVSFVELVWRSYKMLILLSMTEFTYNHWVYDTPGGVLILRGYPQPSSQHLCVTLSYHLYVPNYKSTITKLWIFEILSFPTSRVDKPQLYLAKHSGIFCLQCSDKFVLYYRL